LQLANDLRFTAQKSLAFGARLSKGRSENDEAILERTSGILLEQKLGQSFDNFMRSAASVGRAQKYLFMWLRTYTSLMGRPKIGEHHTDCTVEPRLIAIMFIVQRIASAICSLGSDVCRWKPPRRLGRQ
jgi:hypothetical protein